MKPLTSRIASPFKQLLASNMAITNRPVSIENDRFTLIVFNKEEKIENFATNEYIKTISINCHKERKYHK